MGLRFKSKPVGPFAMNCYVIACEKTGKGAIIDAGEDASWIIDTVEEMGITLEAFLQTHAHIDHVGALSEVKARWPEVPIWIHRDEMPLYEQAPMQGMFFGIRMAPLPAPDKHFEDDDVILIGALRFRVILTPGHTPGGVAFYEADEGVLFSGDTLFAGSIGRTDLPGGHYDTLIQSLGRLRELPESTQVLSGHGPATTVGLSLIHISEPTRPY